ncbi:mitogen-activated protein kinase kinase kinase 7, partial [Aphelenchoides avenae]
ADLLEQLRHENIVKILALFHGEEDGLVLELMEGGSLHELLHERPHVQYFECHVLGWAQQVAAALRHLHRNGYLHRDLKPRK